MFAQVNVLSQSTDEESVCVSLVCTPETDGGGDVGGDGGGDVGGDIGGSGEEAVQFPR